LASGRGARARVPRSSHGLWEPAADRPDPIALLEAQAETRLADLVPLRYGRMATSPFAFFRGAAEVMAADLAATQDSGVRVQLCGDAHIGNFGGFATPERELVFSINDFDETLPGPWEWDVKRLAASIAVAGRHLGLNEARRRQAAAGAVRQYRTAMETFATMRDLDVWYARLDAAKLVARWRRAAVPSAVGVLERAIERAHVKDSLRALARLTHEVDGRHRIIHDPPLVVPVEDLVPGRDPARLEQIMRTKLGLYRRTLPHERRRLLDRYHYEHFGRKVVGVGSVGTSTWIVLLLGRDTDDPLFLQVKEAQPSVLAPHAGASRYANQAQRVVEGQRLMQTTSDIFLGWLRTEGIDGIVKDFYVRQLWDWKMSADVDTMAPPLVSLYGEACGWTLARAHARSGDRIAIAGYLGGGPRFDVAMAEFAERYADQNELDHTALLRAIETGQVTAMDG
jgi:uncharacterized protein (DUF2252 family)